jgi:hypothetical protein
MASTLFITDYQHSLETAQNLTAQIGEQWKMPQFMTSHRTTNW